MDSFMSGFSHYTTGNQQIGHAYTGGASTGGAGAVNNSAPAQNVDVSQLQTGDTFQGEIASVNGEDVQIQLANGQYMAAKLERDVQVALGQVLNLQVLSNKDNKLVLKPVYDSSLQMQRVGVSALKTANLAVTEKNLQLVAKLIENGMSINKNTLMTFNRLALQHPQADVADLIKLTKLQMPVTDKNLAQYENYRNLEHKLLDGVKDASNEVFELYESLLTTKTPAGGMAPQALLAQAGRYMEKVLQFLAEEGARPEAPAASDAANAAVQGETVPESGGALPGAEAGKTAALPEEALLQSADGRNSAVGTDTAREAVQARQPLQETSANKEDAGARTEESQWRDMVSRLKETAPRELPDKLARLIDEGSLDARGMKWLLSESSLAKMLTPELKSALFKSKPFQAMVRRELQNQWTLSPQEIAEEGKTQAFYEKLMRQSSRLLQIMNDAIQENGSAAPPKALNNIRENVEFMNQMNQMFHYVQLPLKLTNSQAHGDLYVYTNKKNLARRDGMLTAFLHLDMENLGGMDISIALQTDQNQVTTKFYLEKDAIALIEEHIDELTQRLAKRGYQCKNTIQVKEEEKTVLQHMEEQVAGGMAPIGYQSFDMRT